MRVRMTIRLERPSTGSSLETGIEFEVRPGENRVDQVETAELLISQNFPRWRISEMQFV